MTTEKAGPTRTSGVSPAETADSMAAAKLKEITERHERERKLTEVAIRKFLADEKDPDPEVRLFSVGDGLMPNLAAALGIDSRGVNFDDHAPTVSLLQVSHLVANVVDIMRSERTK